MEDHRHRREIAGPDRATYQSRTQRTPDRCHADQELLASGADMHRLRPIVSSGPNSASPHAVPTNRTIRPGDLLVIDWGVYVDDYHPTSRTPSRSDPIDDELRRIYEVVKMASEEARRRCGPASAGGRSTG